MTANKIEPNTHQVSKLGGLN